VIVRPSSILAFLAVTLYWRLATPPNPVKAQSLQDDALPPPPTSSISLYELGFGTVAGICAGVFVKKGVKAAAWLLGGIFVLLQVSHICVHLAISLTPLTFITVYELGVVRSC